MSKRKLLIGIDTGVHTGVAVWSPREYRFEDLRTLPIHKAMALVLSLHADAEVVVYFEDARMIVYGRER